MRSLFLLLALAACDAKSQSGVPTAAPAAATKQPRSVTGADAKAAVAAGATLVDVRTPDEFAELHLEGAKNVPLQDLANQLASIPKDKPVVVYCAVGARSAKAASMLAAAGYDVLNLGAMGNWKQ